MRKTLTAAAILTAAMLLAATSSAARQSEGAKRTGTIAFVRGDGDLYVIRADGSGLHRVTPPATHVLDESESTFGYAWSPNGRQIAYIDARRHSLWLVQSDGSRLRRLLSGSRIASTALTWSPDGKKIAIVARGPKKTWRAVGSARIYIVPIQRPQPRLLRGTAFADALSNLTWSPRGNEIAYEVRSPAQTSGIWVTVIHPDGTRYRFVSDLGSGPQWSADGTQLGLVRPVGPFGNPNRAGLAVVGADGNGFRLVTTHAYTEYPFAWSPHGRRILYGGRRRGIYVIDSNGRSNRRVTSDSPPKDLGSKLAWSPDGQSIVYVSARGGLYEVGVNGHGKVQLTKTLDGEWAPSWVAH